MVHGVYGSLKVTAMITLTGHGKRTPGNPWIIDGDQDLANALGI
jgi:hypothetical protein